MKKLISLLLALSLLCSLFCIADMQAAAKSKTVTVKVLVNLNYDYANECVKIVNKERAKKGLKPYKVTKELFDIAQQRAAELAVRYYNAADGSAHRRPDGSAAWKIKGVVTENTAGNPNPNQDFPAKDVMKLWMKSKGHRPAILNPKLTAIGIGCVVCEGCTYWVQVFGKGNPKKSYSKKGTAVVAKNIKVTKQYLYMNVSRVYSEDDEAPLPQRFYICTRLCEGAIVDPKQVSYSYDKKLASIDKNGLLTFKKAGTLKVTAKLKNTSCKSFTASYTYKPSLEVALNQSTFVYNGEAQKPYADYVLKSSKYKGYDFQYFLPEKSTDVGGYTLYAQLTEHEDYSDAIEWEPYDYEDDEPEVDTFDVLGHRYYTYTPDEKQSYAQQERDRERYSETIALHYQIVPQGTALTALKSGKGSATVSWTAQPVQTAGYEIQYADNASFKNAKSKKVKNPNAASVKISGLKNKKKYYFRVRTYQTQKTDEQYPELRDYLYEYYGMTHEKYTLYLNSSWSQAGTVNTK